MKTHWKLYHSPDYIGAYAFQPGERKVLTIKKATQETVKSQRGSEECLVVHWEENEKPLIANVTNSKAIEKVTGSGYIEDWVGHKVELYVTEVSAFGDVVDAVRVKTTKPKTTKPKLEPDTDAWTAAIESVINGDVTFEKLAKLRDVDIELFKEAVADVKATLDQLEAEG